MPKYATIQKPPKRPTSPVGSRLAPQYKHDLVDVEELVYDELGVVKCDAEGKALTVKVKRDRLVKVGDTNIYAKIQEGKDDCDVYKILDRFTAGDVSALHRKAHGIYADLTIMPDNIHEAAARVDKAMDDFMSLPAEVREAFGNDPEKFVSLATEAPDQFKKPFLDFYKKYGVNHENLEKKGEKIDEQKQSK